MIMNPEIPHGYSLHFDQSHGVRQPLTWCTDLRDQSLWLYYSSLSGITKLIYWLMEIVIQWLRLCL